MKNDKVKIGVLGTGIIIRDFHLLTLQNHPKAEIVAAGNLHPESLEHLAAEFHIPKTYTDFAMRAADPDIDAVRVGMAVFGIGLTYSYPLDRSSPNSFQSFINILNQELSGGIRILRPRQWRNINRFRPGLQRDGRVAGNRGIPIDQRLITMNVVKIKPVTGSGRALSFKTVTGKEQGFT